MREEFKLAMFNDEAYVRVSDSDVGGFLCFQFHAVNQITNEKRCNANSCAIQIDVVLTS